MSIAPAPVAPGTITRAADGSVTIRAFRVSGPVEVDGRYEEFYRTVPPFGGFIQQDPMEGAPATEPTDAWIYFDDQNLYVAARCWDSHPEREIANEMRLDSNSNLELKPYYQPGSEMFVVFSDGRDTALDGFPRAFNRAFIVKINRLFRF